jgi:hypothetical protein
MLALVRSSAGTVCSREQAPSGTLHSNNFASQNIWTFRSDSSTKALFSLFSNSFLRLLQFQIWLAVPDCAPLLTKGQFWSSSFLPSPRRYCGPCRACPRPYCRKQLSVSSGSLSLSEVICSLDQSVCPNTSYCIDVPPGNRAEDSGRLQRDPLWFRCKTPWQNLGDFNNKGNNNNNNNNNNSINLVVCMTTAKQG